MEIRIRNLPDKYGHADIVKALIEAGADVNAKNNEEQSALMLALGTNHTQIAELLKKSGAKEPSKTDIIEQAKRALASGADVNARGTQGATFLMIAVRAGDLDTVQKLLARGANVNARDDDGRSALMVASFYGQTEIIKALLDKGADVNAQDKDSSSALMIAAQYGHTRVVRELVAKGADVNAEDAGGWTALRLAEKFGSAEIVRLLADAASKNKPKIDPRLLVAPEKGDTEKARINRWTSHGPEGGVITALALDPQNPSTVYAGTMGAGVLKSTNGGTSLSG